MKNNWFLWALLSVLGIGMCQAQCVDILNFSGANGSTPKGSLLLSGNKLYGMTYAGGANADGCVFSLDTNGSGYKDMLDFDGTKGANPYYGKLMVSAGKLFGMTSKGGANGEGCVFSLDTNGGGYKDLLDFSGTNGQYPYGSVTLVGKLLYGMTYQGGANSDGCIFSIDSSGGGYRDLYDFIGTAGQNPCGGLTLSGKVLYGTTEYGGSAGNGCIFSIDTNGTGYKDMLDFGDQTPPLGANPTGDLVLNSGKLFGLCSAGGLTDFGCAFVIDTDGSNYKNIVDLGGTKGYFPFGTPTIIGAKMYGMAYQGGAANKGTIFSVDTNGSLYTVLLDFNSTTFSNPYGSFAQSGMNFYGLTTIGGTNNDGVAFKFNYVTAGVTELSNTNVFRLYPNPSNGIFQLKITNYELGINGNLAVYNVLGEKVYSKQFQVRNSQCLIDMSAQPAGMYLYRITSVNGNELATGRFIIEK